jgi:hypothetical protein
MVGSIINALQLPQKFSRYAGMRSTEWHRDRVKREQGRTGKIMQRR